MTKNRAEKILELRALAEEFREKAMATSQPGYIELMTQAAEELTVFADALERIPQNAGTEESAGTCKDCAA